MKLSPGCTHVLVWLKYLSCRVDVKCNRLGKFQTVTELLNKERRGKRDTNKKLKYETFLLNVHFKGDV